MKKFKILFILIVFMFIGIFEVKAIDCVQMPGVNNTYYIPKNGSAYCHYRPLEGEGIGSNPQKEVLLEYDGKTQSFILSLKDGNGIVRINSNYTFSDLNNVNWDEYRLEQNNGSGYFTSNVLVDYENIDGCPQYVYWIVSASDRDRIVGISGDYPSISYNKGNEDTNGYAIYEYVEDDYSYIEDLNEGLAYYFDNMEDSDNYSEFLKTCLNKEKSDYEKGGYSSYTGGINSKTEETLATCKYYFGLQYSDTSCKAEEVTLIYKYIKEFDKNKNKYSYNMDVKINNSNIDIYEIQNSLKSKPLQDKSKLDDLINEMYTNEFVKDTISQYITYKDGKWECADTLYISTTGTSNKHVLQGEETGVTSSKFYSEANAVFKSTKEKSTACDYYIKEESEKPSGANTYKCLDHSNDVACGSVYNIPRELPQLTSLFFNIIKIMAPIALIIKALIDLLKGMAASKEDEIIKARSKIFKRLVPALTIFLLIMILQVVFGIIGTEEEANTFNKCATCFLSNRCEDNIFDSEAYCRSLQNDPTQIDTPISTDKLNPIKTDNKTTSSGNRDKIIATAERAYENNSSWMYIAPSVRNQKEVTSLNGKSVSGGNCLSKTYNGQTCIKYNKKDYYATDCNGFVGYVYHTALGIENSNYRYFSPNYSAKTWDLLSGSGNYFTKVGDYSDLSKLKENAQKGDAIGRICNCDKDGQNCHNHIGIYAGNGMVYENSGSTSSIEGRISPLKYRTVEQFAKFNDYKGCVVTLFSYNG